MAARDDRLPAPGSTISAEQARGLLRARKRRPSRADPTQLGPEATLEQQLFHKLTLAGIPPPQAQYQAVPERRWHADFAYPDVMLLVEVEGGTYANGRHSRGREYYRDTVKYNALGIAGWLVLRFTVDAIEGDTQEAVDTIRAALAARAVRPI